MSVFDINFSFQAYLKLPHASEASFPAWKLWPKVS